MLTMWSNTPLCEKELHILAPEEEAVCFSWLVVACNKPRPVVIVVLVEALPSGSPLVPIVGPENMLKLIVQNC